MGPYFFGSRLTAPYTGSFGIRKETRMETHSLQKTREKLKNALTREPEGRVSISNKLARSIQEHLWRLAELEK